MSRYEVTVWIGSMLAFRWFGLASSFYDALKRANWDFMAKPTFDWDQITDTRIMKIEDRKS